MSEENFLARLYTILKEGLKKEIFGHPNEFLLSMFGGVPLSFDLSQSFPAMTTRKTPVKSAISEMLWYIQGTGDVVQLKQDYKVSVWDKWAVQYHNKKQGTTYSTEDWASLVESGEITSEVIPLHYTNLTRKRFIATSDICAELDGKAGYCKSHYKYSYLDQTKWAIDGLRKTPYRKSFHITMWEPETVYAQADYCGNESVVLPACWHSHTLNYDGEKLNMSVLGRSWDIWTAGAWNIAQYSALLMMYAHCLKMQAGKIEFYTTDTHIYSNLIEQTKEQLSRKPFPFPKMIIKDRGQEYLQDFVPSDFKLVNYESHPLLKGQITVVGGY